MAQLFRSSIYDLYPNCEQIGRIFWWRTLSSVSQLISTYPWYLFLGFSWSKADQSDRRQDMIFTQAFLKMLSWLLTCTAMHWLVGPHASSARCTHAGSDQQIITSLKKKKKKKISKHKKSKHFFPTVVTTIVMWPY